MSIARRDDYLTDAQGRALAGAQVYYCTQPATTSTIPPSPLAPVFSDSTGTASTNPQVTDGFGHSVAYLTAGFPYTLMFVHPLFASPVVLPDQLIGGGVASVIIPVTPAGTINGVGNSGNRIFTLPIPSVNPTASQLFLNGTLIGQYTIVGTTLTYTTPLPPQIGDFHELYYS